MKTTQINYLAILLFTGALSANAQSLNAKTTGPVPQGLAWGQTDQAAIDFFTNLTSRPKKILTAKDINGSPYLKEEFRLAKVY